ncbi:MAG: hypothetical protein HQL87_16615 [Magnetococcales bacterium]|nr:hypothetical protein [Magnetococcales bacterium]
MSACNFGAEWLFGTLADPGGLVTSAVTSPGDAGGVAYGHAAEQAQAMRRSRPRPIRMRAEGSERIRPPVTMLVWSDPF